MQQDFLVMQRGLPQIVHQVVLQQLNLQLNLAHKQAEKMEFLIPILCGLFLVESLSVIMQVSWFKYTKKKYGEGRRIFLMAPLHHHFQKKGVPEPKIVARFWIIGIALAIFTVITLKIR